MQVQRWELDATENGAALVCDKTPFITGRSAALHVSITDTRTLTFNFQYSDDGGTTWTNYLSATELGQIVGGRSAVFGIKLGEQVRPTVSAHTSGKVNVALVAGL